jgi:preprotein translocase subunit YajC
VGREHAHSASHKPFRSEPSLKKSWALCTEPGAFADCTRFLRTTTRRSMKIPDYISPVVGHRVWRWNEAGLKSLNGETWLPGQYLEARCRVAPAARHIAEAANEVPHRKCTCGIYAAKDSAHLREIGYADHGVCGEVYLWGTMVEHRLGWRAQFAYPRNLVVPFGLLPFTLAELNVRMDTLIAFGTDIFVLRNSEMIGLWKKGTGYDPDGLDHIISLRGQHYIRQQQRRTLRKGDRVALLGRAIAVVQQINENDVVLVFGKTNVLRIARKDIVLNKHNRRWEYADNKFSAIRRPSSAYIRLCCTIRPRCIPTQKHLDNVGAAKRRLLSRREGVCGGLRQIQGEAIPLLHLHEQRSSSQQARRLC